MKFLSLCFCIYTAFYIVNLEYLNSYFHFQENISLLSFTYALWLRRTCMCVLVSHHVTFPFDECVCVCAFVRVFVICFLPCIDVFVRKASHLFVFVNCVRSVDGVFLLFFWQTNNWLLCVY